MKKLPIEKGAYQAPWTSVFLLQQEYNFCNTGSATLDKIEEDPDDAFIWEDDD